MMSKKMKLILYEYPADPHQMRGWQGAMANDCDHRFFEVFVMLFLLLNYFVFVSPPHSSCNCGS